VALSKDFVYKACFVLQEVNPLAMEILTEYSDKQLGTMFRNCVVTIFTDPAGTCQMIYTDVQFMDQEQKDLFYEQSEGLPGAFLLELEQDITRIGFK